VVALPRWWHCRGGVAAVGLSFPGAWVFVIRHFLVYFVDLSFPGVLFFASIVSWCIFVGSLFPGALFLLSIISWCIFVVSLFPGALFCNPSFPGAFLLDGSDFLSLVDFAGGHDGFGGAGCGEKACGSEMVHS